MKIMKDYEFVDRDELEQLDAEIITEIELDKMFNLFYMSSTNNLTYVCSKKNKDIVNRIRFRKMVKRIKRRLMKR